jgi:hypothetical protein
MTRLIRHAEAAPECVNSILDLILGPPLHFTEEELELAWRSWQAADEGPQSRQLLGLEAFRTMSNRLHTVEIEGFGPATITGLTKNQIQASSRPRTTGWTSDPATPAARRLRAPHEGSGPATQSS